MPEFERRIWYYPKRRNAETMRTHKIGDAFQYDGRITLANEPFPDSDIEVHGIPHIVGHHVGEYDINRAPWKSPEYTLENYRRTCEAGDLIFTALPPIEGTDAYDIIRDMGWDGDKRNVPAVCFDEDGNACLLTEAVDANHHVDTPHRNPPCSFSFNGGTEKENGFFLHQPITEWYENLWDFKRWRDFELLSSVSSFDNKVEFSLIDTKHRQKWTIHAAFSGFAKRELDLDFYDQTLEWGKDAWRQQQELIAARDKREFDAKSPAEQAKIRAAAEKQRELQAADWEKTKAMCPFYTPRDLMALEIQAARQIS